MILKLSIHNNSPSHENFQVFGNILDNDLYPSIDGIEEVITNSTASPRSQV
jgi:hypothetical protein